MSDQDHQFVRDGVRCEGCGYALAGISRGGVCSECGLAVALSLPRKRAGTPWQQRAGIGSLVRTWWLLIVDDECWREMRIDRRSRRRFAGWLRVLVYGVLLVAALAFVLVESQEQVDPAAFGFYAFLLIALMIAVEIVVRVYGTLIDLRLFFGSALRSEGLEEAAHQQVREYASVGILVAPLLLAVGVVCLTLGIVLEGVTGSMTMLRVMFWIAGSIGALGMVVGVVLFELAYQRGWRVMRYRRLVGDEREQVYHDDFNDALIGHPIDNFFGFGEILIAKKREPMRVFEYSVGLALKYVLTPVLFFVLWKGYGMDAGAALILALVGLVVCAVVVRVVMLLLGIVQGRKLSR